MAQFHARHPQVRFDLQVSDRRVDLVEEGFDLAIRIGVLGSDQLVARKLGQMRLLLCAAPGYLRRRGTPRTPADLERHDLLTYAYSRSPRQWLLRATDGALSEVRAQGSLHANNGAVLVAAAQAGQGIVLETDFHVAAALDNGSLVRVLPEYDGGGGDIWAVYPSRRHLSAKVRLFVEHLIQVFAAAAPEPAVRRSRPRRGAR
jgi:DNA-binding transcriptional LysR family regulator